MSFSVNNLFNNSNIKCVEQKGQYEVYEHQVDLSCSPKEAMDTYFMEKKNIKRRQLLCKLENSNVKIQAGTMQWTVGNITMDANGGDKGGYLGKFAKGLVTGESMLKPVFSGNGYLMLEPTYKHLLIEDVADWGGSIVLNDGLFLACDTSLNETLTKRGIVSAVLSGEGMFNLTLSGQGLVVLESPIPRAELYEITLNNDTLKIDGDMAIAWSSSIELTSERSAGTIIGDLATEGMINVFRGTGKVLMAPTLNGASMVSSIVQNVASKGPLDKLAKFK